MTHDARVLVDLPHRLRFTERAFDPSNPLLRELIVSGESSMRAQLFIDSGVHVTHPGLPAEAARWAAEAGITLAGDASIVPGGEVCKNDPSVLSGILRAMHDAKLCRRSTAIVVGGGAVLDAVGYAAAVVHRGVRLVRVPSTTLAQCDSGVGVKNGVNAYGKKNYLGTFAVPWAVVNDESLLVTLSDEHWIAGFSEVVKVALLKDAALFETLEADAGAIASRDPARSIPPLRRSAALHLAHICDGGDPFELSRARPLDFGHWAAHKLEQMTAFELSHGHAVAIGLALDVCYASEIGLLEPSTRDRVLAVLEAIGFTLNHPKLEDCDALLGGLEEFREHLGGELTITLIDAIGSQKDVHTIDTDAMARCARALAVREAAQPVR